MDRHVKKSYSSPGEYTVEYTVGALMQMKAKGLKTVNIEKHQEAHTLIQNYE